MSVIQEKQMLISASSDHHEPHLLCGRAGRAVCVDDRRVDSGEVWKGKRGSGD